MSYLARAIRDTISSLHNTSEVYTADSEKADDIPQAFHGVAKALPPAEDALKAIKNRRKQKEDPSQASNEHDAAERFHAKALRLYEIFDAVVPPGDTPRMARYRSAAGKGEAVEILMTDILKSILVLAKEPLVSKDQIVALQKALQDVSKIPRSLQDDETHSFHNYGAGPQSVHLGKGNQNINTGAGIQFNDGRFQGAFNLPK